MLLAMGLAFALPTQAQKPIRWEDLAEVEVVLEKKEGARYPTTRAIFGEEVKALAGREVRITGYVLPVDVSGNQYVLSAFPYASCFFCGGAGRESVLKLELQPDQGPYEMDQRLSFVGRLKLVESQYDLIYRLESAREAK